MFKSIITAIAIVLSGHAWAIGASQEWVKDYIARLNGSTNNVYSVDAGTNGVITATYEMYTVPALVVTNSVDLSVTNGFMFAYTSNGVYRAGARYVQATTTNLVYSGISSVVTNGLDTFEGHFQILGKMITPSLAMEVAQ